MPDPSRAEAFALPSFGGSTELDELVRRFVETELTEARLRTVIEGDRGFDARAWGKLANELGMTGLPIPEELGGSGAGLAEVVSVVFELGRALALPQYLSTVALASTVLIRGSNDELKRRWLPRIAAGTATGTVVGFEHGPGAMVDLPQVRQHGTELRLDATLSPVLDGADADLLVVLAGRPGEEVFVAAEFGVGAKATLLEGLDLTRRFARVDLSDQVVYPICRPEDTPALLELLTDVAATAAAAEQIGGASRCLELAVAYATTRIQFGRPIGSFQSIKHICADMFVRVRCAEALLRDATAKLDSPGPERSLAASAASAFASDVFLEAAKENLQVHGGSGFTWDNPAHLYLRRAKVLHTLFGSPPAHRARLAGLVGAA
jgi:alkylation response protein AidB-like acyl-CoA dehydrogenase